MGVGVGVGVGMGVGVGVGVRVGVDVGVGVGVGMKLVLLISNIREDVAVNEEVSSTCVMDKDSERLSARVLVRGSIKEKDGRELLLLETGISTEVV